MKNKITELFGIPIAFLFLGVLFLIFGANGEGLATTFSRPSGASSWTTEGSTIDAFTFIPIILGVSFLILFVSTFSISFNKWQKGR
ncbi:hypothetical protein [Sporosarcina sp. SAFN-010]|uniref:hypothetical protein n=1 Tax=Sporosarcina sp. SAFN-010 TaxID=3387273 RepID=UPI003F7E0893